jgi:hypothetical protein
MKTHFLYITLVIIFLTSCSFNKEKKEIMGKVLSKPQITVRNANNIALEDSLVCVVIQNNIHEIWHQWVVIEKGKEEKDYIELTVKNGNPKFPGTPRGLFYRKIRFGLNFLWNDIEVVAMIGEDSSIIGYEIFDTSYVSPEGLKIGDTYNKVKKILGEKVKKTYYPYESKCVLLPTGLAAKFDLEFYGYNNDMNFPDTIIIRCFEKSGLVGNIFNAPFQYFKYPKE